MIGYLSCLFTYLLLSRDRADFSALRPFKEYHSERARARLALEVEEEVLVDAAPSSVQLLLLGVGFIQVAFLAAESARLSRQILQMLVVKLDRLRNSRHGYGSSLTKECKLCYYIKESYIPKLVRN